MTVMPSIDDYSIRLPTPGRPNKKYTSKYIRCAVDIISLSSRCFSTRENNRDRENARHLNQYHVLPKQTPWQYSTFSGVWRLSQMQLHKTHVSSKLLHLEAHSVQSEEKSAARTRAVGSRSGTLGKRLLRPVRCSPSRLCPLTWSARITAKELVLSPASNSGWRSSLTRTCTPRETMGWVSNNSTQKQPLQATYSTRTTVVCASSEQMADPYPRAQIRSCCRISCLLCCRGEARAC